MKLVFDMSNHDFRACVLHLQHQEQSMALLGDLPPPPRRYSRPRAAQVGCVIGALAAAAAVTHPATWAADGRTRTEMDMSEVMRSLLLRRRDVSFLTSFDFDGGGGKIPEWN